MSRESAADQIMLPSDQNSTGRTFGPEEVAALTRALQSGVLTSTKGTFTKEFETRFAKMVGAKHGFACSSGTAAIHVAIGAINPEPGEEIVTTSITDMGALTPILYQGAIPVFADVDPKSCNVTAASIEKVLSDKTRAIIVTHLFGNPCDMESIMKLADERGIPVIEDCAQAFEATIAGKPVGRHGAIGCFSFQQGKHITTGEGGLVVSDDDELARRCFLHINKAWGYGDQNADHYFAALNYRMSELQGAVALAQLPKLRGVVEARVATADMLSEALANVPGIEVPKALPGAKQTYWKYCLNVDENVIEGGSPGLGAALREKGIACAPRYVVKPAFRCQVFAEKRTFGTSGWPFTLARSEAVDYSESRFPGTFDGLRDILVLPWNEKYTKEHVDYIADAVRGAVSELKKG